MQLGSVMNIPGMNADGSISPPLHLQAAHRISEGGSAAAMRAQQHQLVIDATVARSTSAGGAMVLRPSNTNGNANCDIAGVDVQHKTASTSTPSSILGDININSRLHPNSSSSSSNQHHLHMLTPSPHGGGSSSYINGGGVASSDFAMEEDNKLDRESHLQRLTSPIIADLPLISMRSPPLSLDFAASENGNANLQSPNGVASGGGIVTAKYSSLAQVGLENRTVSSSPTTDSCSSLSPIASLTANSPTSGMSANQQQSLFQPGLLVADHRSPTLLLHTTALSPTASPLMEEEMDDNGPFICCWENCNQEFPQLEALVGHLDRDHTLAMDKYVCQWKDCARSRKPFDARYKLITHLRCHTGEKPYRCEYPTCTRSFSRLENLKLHVRTHTGEKPYECHYEGCTKKFNNTSDRAKHMKTHITRKPYVCKYPGCGKSYTDPSSMRKHIKYTHKLKERQDEHGGNRQDSGLINSSSQLRGNRKRSVSGSSTSPTTPRLIQHPGVVSINGQLIQALPTPPILTSTSSSLAGPPINVAAANAVPQPQQQPQLIQVPLVQIPGVPSSVPQPLSFLAPSSSPLLSQGAITQHQQQQQVVMLLPSPATGVANTGRDIIALSPHPQNAITKLQQQSPLTPVQLLQQTVSKGNESRLEQIKSQSAVSVLTKSEADLEEQLRQQIAHLQQQLLQSQQAQLIAQQQVAQLQQQAQSQVESGMELIDKQDRKSTPSASSGTFTNHTPTVSSSGGSPIKLPPSKVTIVTSSWPPPAQCGNGAVSATAVLGTTAPPTIKSSQPSITSLSSSSFLSSPPLPPPVTTMVRSSKASGQILLTSSTMPATILSPTGHHQTTVLPTHQVPVVLGQAAAAGGGSGPQVIPLVQSQGVSQRQILYMTPHTS